MGIVKIIKIYFNTKYIFENNYSKINKKNLIFGLHLL